MPIHPDTAKHIEELVPLARLARRQHSPEDPKVLASQELTVIFQDLVESKEATISEIAKVADLTYHSVAARVRGRNTPKS